MTKAYAMQQLLKLGPLTLAEAWQITGWERDEVVHTLKVLVSCGSVVAMPENFRFNIRYALSK